MKDIIKKSRNSKKFPDADWLESLGFVMSENKHAHVATITIDSYNDNCGAAKLVLRLQHFKSQKIDEWVTDVESYNEKGKLESSVGLVGSWLTTRAELVRLCIALGVESWKEALEQ